jgi:hypothetical protein
MNLFLDRLGGSIFDPLVWDSLCRRLVLRVMRTVEKANEVKFRPGTFRV